MSAGYEKMLEAARRWDDARRSLATIRSQLSGEECALRNAENELGKLIDPGDMANDEEIQVWIRLGPDPTAPEDVICCKKLGQGTYQLRTRKRHARS